MSNRLKHSFGSKIIIYFLLVIYALWVVVPFVTVMVTSITPNTELLKSLNYVWWPENPTFDAYKIIFTEHFSFDSKYVSLLKGFTNTLWQTIPTMLVGLFVSGFSAFSFAKLKFPAKDALFMVVLALMMIPTAVMTMPSFLFYDAIGWSSSVLPIVIPGLFGSVGTVFFLRQFMLLIPDSIVEAARVDGANIVRIYVGIIVPISMPAFVTQVIFSFVSGYNAYGAPLLYLSSTPELQPLQIAFTTLRGLWGDDKSVLCASCLIAMAPLIIFYICTQQYFIENMSSAAVKG